MSSLILAHVTFLSIVGAVVLSGLCGALAAVIGTYVSYMARCRKTKQRDTEAAIARGVNETLEGLPDTGLPGWLDLKTRCQGCRRMRRGRMRRRDWVHLKREFGTRMSDWQQGLRAGRSQ